MFPINLLTSGRDSVTSHIHPFYRIFITFEILTAKSFTRNTVVFIAIC